MPLFKPLQRSHFTHNKTKALKMGSESYLVRIP